MRTRIFLSFFLLPLIYCFLAMTIGDTDRNISLNPFFLLEAVIWLLAKSLEVLTDLSGINLMREEALFLYIGIGLLMLGCVFFLLSYLFTFLFSNTFSETKKSISEKIAQIKSK